MDTGSIIIGVVITVICVSPIIIMNYFRVKKQNKKLNSLKEFGKQHGFQIDQHEFCSDFVIGIDKTKDIALYHKRHKEEFSNQFVDLSEIRICKVDKKARIVGSGDESVSVIEQIDLCFIPTNKSTSETRFELFNEAINIQLGDELQFAEKWSRQINNMLK